MPTLALGFCRERLMETEIMDDPALEPEALAPSLTFLEITNRFLGGRSSVLTPLKKILKEKTGNAPVTILDVGCGGADLSREAALLCRREGISASITALDHHSKVADLARVACRSFPEITVREGDVMDRDLPSHDVVFASLVLHHQDDPAGFLRRLSQLAKEALIVSDLLRDVRAYAWVSLASLGWAPIVRNDARVSVRKGFTPKEIRALCAQAGRLDLTFQKTFGYRFVLHG